MCVEAPLLEILVFWSMQKDNVKVAPTEKRKKGGEEKKKRKKREMAPACFSKAQRESRRWDLPASIRGECPSRPLQLQTVLYS